MTDEGPDKITQMPRKPREQVQATELTQSGSGGTTSIVALSLPSPHVSHSEILVNEMTNRLHQFRSAIIAIQGQIEGEQKAHEAAVKELTDKHNASKADLLRRLSDLQRGEKAVNRSLDALNEPEAK